MKRQPGTWRFDVLFGLLMVALAALTVRMAILVRDARAKAIQNAEIQERMAIPLPSRTGNIYGRANTSAILLASSKQVPSAYADVKMVPQDKLADVAIRTGGLLNADPVGIQQTFFQRREDQFVWLRRHISSQQADAIEKARLPGIGLKYEWVRNYPNANLAGSLLGWRRPDGQPGGGLEMELQSTLIGKDGLAVKRADARRRPFEENYDETVLPADGNNVYLTLDVNIQQYLQDAVYASVDKHKAKWGVGVIVDPSTGEVLAMCSYWLDPRTRQPVNFDPNEFNDVPPEARANWAITTPYEPGSAAKTIFAAAAVNEGLVNWDTQFFCENGTFFPPKGGRVSDHGSAYGSLSVQDIIVNSSNIGMAKIGLTAGNKLLYRFAKDFGLGEPTGIELPGESRGLVRQLRRWDTYSTPRVPFGQEISTTALQLAMAYAALANGGELLKPHLVQSVVDSTGKTVYVARKEVVRRVLRPEVSRGAIEAMRQVVLRGTGKAANLGQWSSFGKTGTAQVPSTTPGHPGYIDGAFTSTFVGGAPAENPRVVCVVSIHRPAVGGHYGATVAAPWFKDALVKTLAYLNVPPDQADLHLADGHVSR